MNTFTDAQNNINEIISEYDAIMNKTREMLQDRMRVLFNSFFQSYPEVKTIHWTQYTPYFNDGDECTFSVGEAYFTTTEYADVDCSYGEDDEGNIQTSRWDDEARKYVNATDISEELINSINSLSAIVSSDANEDVMRAMFGNHVWVKAHRDGFQVDEYDHD